MKKVMSLVLASMMLVSLFMVNASAMVIPENAEKLVFSENFDGETNSFTSGTAGALVGGATSEDGNALQSALTGAEINLPEKYVLEFDMMIPAVATHYIYLNDADSATVANVGVRLQDGSVIPETWYSVRVVVDEALMTGTCDINNQQAIILYQKAKGESGWTKSRHQYGTNAIQDPTSGLIQHRPHTAFAKAAMGENAIGFSANMVVDNVKVYNLVYDFVEGTICYTADSITMPTYAGKSDLNHYKYTANPVAPKAEGETEYIITTFDAINTVKGMPLALHISGDYMDTYDANTNNGDTYITTVSILSNDEAASQMYTYKIVSKMVYGKKDMSVETVYRKAVDSNSNYELLTYGQDYIVGDGGRISSGIGSIRFGYRAENSQEAYGYSSEEGAINDFTSTKWEVENVQVVYGNAVMRGFVALKDGNVDADITMVTKEDTATAFIATYEGGVLSDVDFDDMADGEGNVQLSAAYSDAENASATLFVWKNASGEPIIEEIDLTDSL